MSVQPSLPPTATRQATHMPIGPLRVHGPNVHSQSAEPEGRGSSASHSPSASFFCAFGSVCLGCTSSAVRRCSGLLSIVAGRALAWAAWHFGFAAAAAASVATTLRVDAGADCSTDASVQFEAFACALRSAATSTATATLCNCDCDCHSVTVTCNCNCDSNWDCDSGACAISDSKNSFHILRERSLLFFFASKPKKSAKNTQNFDNFNS